MLELAVTMDSEGMVTEWSPVAEGLFGYGHDEAVGRSLGTLIVPEEFRPYHEMGLRRYAQTREAHCVGFVVDIEAVHQNRRSGETVRVRISGRGSDPKLAFLVDGRQVTAGDAFLAIYGSQKSNEDPEEADNQAKHFVGGLTAGLLATSARRELGAAAPILMVEPGDEIGEGRVRAGFELLHRLEGICDER